MTEKSLYSDINLNITNLRIIVHTNKNNLEQTISYAVKNITSVEMITAAYATFWAATTVVIGAYFLLITLVTIAKNISNLWSFEVIFSFVFSLSIIYAGLLWFSNCKPTYSVKIISSAGETNVLLKSQNKEYTEKIMNSINEAIIMCQ